MSTYKTPLARNVSETYMPPWCKIQNYNLYVQGIMNSELCTRKN